MENTEQNRQMVKNFVKEMLLNEMNTNESFMSRIGAAWDTAKDKMMGMGGDVAVAYKKEKALDLYKKYRALFCKANQMKAQVNRKSKAAFAGSANPYATAKQFAMNECDFNNLKKAISESLTDEGFWSGLKNVGRNFSNSMQNGNSIADKFHNMQQDYHQGDAAGDASDYSKLFGEVNQAKAAFVNYCKQNGFVPKAIAQEYKSQVRQGIVGGDKSKSAYSMATNGGNERFRGAAPSADNLNASRTKMQGQRNQTNQARVWEEEK